MALLRFFRNGVIVGTVDNEDEVPVLELAEDGGIEIPRNCTSGNCGTCMVNLLSGSVPMPEPLPPGLDDNVSGGTSARNPAQVFLLAGPKV